MPRFPALLLSSLCCAAPLLAGCPQPEGCLPHEQPRFTIGTGVTGFTPLDEDSPEMQLVFGTQGGFHVDIAIDATGLDARGDSQAHLEGFLDGNLAGESRPFGRFRCNPNTNSLQAWGLRLIWDAQPDDLIDELVDIHAEITDVAGVSAESEVTGVRILAPEGF